VGGGWGGGGVGGEMMGDAAARSVDAGRRRYDSTDDIWGGDRGPAPPMDQAWAGLLSDLKERGLLEKTLIVWTGEVGRTPQINNRAGRDHHVRSWSTALAGCGIKG